MVYIGVPLVFLAFVSLVSATPTHRRASTITVPISRKVGTITAAELIAKEKVRIASFSGCAPIGNQSITNEDGRRIITQIGNQTFSLIIDTGSSNTWVGADTPYVPSSSSESTGAPVTVTYGSGSFSGLEYIDKVTLGGLTVTRQSIGDAQVTSGFTGVDGIIGFGPVTLTRRTVIGQTTVPTFMNNLHSQGTIATEVLGVYFAPESGSNTEEINGELTLGGVDPSKYTGTLSYFPKSTVDHYSAYWGVDIASITYGSTNLATSVNAIVDTGTTLIYLPDFAYHSFLNATGGTTDSKTHLPSQRKCPCWTFTIKLGSVSLPLTPAQYLVPQAQYSNFGLNPNYYYAWINNGGGSDAPVNFILGQKFLENYYSVFDTTNSKVGFAVRT
ncbi:hypothetical protein BS47DRAFT_1332559 [Hydnum rufescens UP504]|uniref:Peptidase A1 domain-containing protein n=1 Tax=Hydnum rufescens UP504 TaxID=1448309 RepID=A0A9P6AP10_9AGAM|nr:hypothetical protein BS47DRAFT_1332559 [Hydnum rufescens UP504]